MENNKVSLDLLVAQLRRGDMNENVLNIGFCFPDNNPDALFMNNMNNSKWKPEMLTRDRKMYSLDSFCLKVGLASSY